MSRTMYDSTTAADIPASAQMVAGYVDGLDRWSEQDWARFPAAVKVGIAVNPNTDAGQVGDVESGDMTPSTALNWVRLRRRSGAQPTLYATWGGISAIAQVFDGAGEPEPPYWLALYDGQAVLPPGVVAKQYANQALSGGHFDLSIVADYWPGVDAMQLDPNDPTVQAIRHELDQIANAVVNGVVDNQGGLLGQLQGLRHEVDQIANAVVNGAVDNPAGLLQMVKDLQAALASLPGAGVAEHAHLPGAVQR